MTAIFLAALLIGTVATEMTSSSKSDVSSLCPAYCRCVATTRSVDCSGQQLTEIESTIDQLDAGTEVLDLRNNQLTTIRSRSFSALTNLSVILLDDNTINDVQQYAFQGLYHLQTLSLTRNRLTTIHSNSFSDLSGSAHLCNSSSARNVTTYCTLDLTQNNIVLIERNAFAWIQRLQILLGRSEVAMTVGAYAFYGARLIPRVEITRIPSLTLKPRIFTNTEDVLSVDITQTTIERLDNFVFEGLKNVDKIQFTGVTVVNVQSFAFSGVQFRRHHLHTASVDVNSQDGRAVPDQDSVDNTEISNRSRRKESRVERYTHSGGMVSFENCRLDLVQTDAFRDTNVAHIEIIASRLGNIEKRAFQAVVGLQSLRIADCHFASNRLTTDSLASLRGLQRIDIVDNDFSIVEPFVLRDVIDIDIIYIRFRSSKVTLLTEAFSQVSDVDELWLSGNNGTSSSESGRQTLLVVDVGAFRNLVGIELICIENFFLPVIKRHTFSGLSRIANLTVAHCDVTTIERESFGDSASHLGAIEQFDISMGNQISCDCSVGSLLRELELRFSSYTAYCYVTEDRPEGSVRTSIPLQHGVLHTANIACSAATFRTVASVTNTFVVLVFAIVVFSVFGTR